MTSSASLRSKITALLLGTLISVVWLAGLAAGFTPTEARISNCVRLPDVVVIGKRALPENESESPSVLATNRATDTTRQTLQQ